MGEIPIVVSCIKGKKSYVVDVCRQRTALIEQRGKAEWEIEQTQMEAHQQRETLAQLIDRVNQQARIIGELQVQSLTGSIPRVSSDVSNTHSHQGEGRQTKTSKTPNLPNFSGEIPTPKGEAEFDNWIFQIKSPQSTYTDDAIRNAVVSNVRGIAKMVVHAVGYDHGVIRYDLTVRRLFWFR